MRSISVVILLLLSSVFLGGLWTFSHRANLSRTPRQTPSSAVTAASIDPALWPLVSELVSPTPNRSPQTADSSSLNRGPASIIPISLATSLSASGQATTARELVQAYAPLVWLHPSEPFQPMDPLEFIRGSSLWERNAWGPNRKVADAGSIQPNEIGRLASGVYTPSGDGSVLDSYYLKYEDPSLGTGQDRDWNFAALGTQNAHAETSPHRVPVSAPMLWKVGKDPTEKPNRVLIEYWYYLPFSHATQWSLGNHQGDWESIGMLIELKESATQRPQHRLVAAYYSSHERGSWHCPSDLQWQDEHPVAFSALGTHATYSNVGKFPGPVLVDHTDRGRSWESWKSLRPLAREPYYGFAGAWGPIHALPIMSGPVAPGPDFKPVLRAPASAIQQQMREQLSERCAI